MLNIDHVSYFVPENRIDVESNADRFKITRAQAKVFSKIYGLQSVPTAAGLSIVDFVKKSVDKLIKESRVEKDQVKVLIHTHTANVITKFGNSVVREIKNDLKLTKALAFGMSLNNCASTLDAIETAGILLRNYDSNAKAIVVTGEMAFTPNVQVIPNTSITGDATAAVLVGVNGKKNKLIALEMKILGKYSKGIWLSFEKSKDFEKNYVPMLSQTILCAAEKANLSLSDIKLILPHNVNLISWANTAKYLNISQNKIYLDNVRKYAHCFGADIFINYTDAIKEGKIENGDYFMLATVGLGATFAAAIFRH